MQLYRRSTPIDLGARNFSFHPHDLLVTNYLIINHESRITNLRLRQNTFCAVAQTTPIVWV